MRKIEDYDITQSYASYEHENFLERIIQNQNEIIAWIEKHDSRRLPKGNSEELNRKILEEQLNQKRCFFCKQNYDIEYGHACPASELGNRTSRKWDD